MRHLPRLRLPQRAVDALEHYQDDLDRKIEVELKAQTLKTSEVVDAAWKRHRSSKAMEVVELSLRAMASGIERCMYCEDGQGCDVEHLHPKANGKYHDRTFVWLNLLWICSTCNRQKGDSFDEDMLDPTTVDPLDHIVLSFGSGKYTTRGDSRSGAATLRAIRRLADDQTLEEGRRNAWKKLQWFLAIYDSCCSAGQGANADEIRQVIVEEPFSAVFAALLRASLERDAKVVLGEAVLDVLSRRPEVRRWLEDADDARRNAIAPTLQDTAKRIRIPKVATNVLPKSE